MKDEPWKDKRNEITPTMSQIKLKAMYPLILGGTRSLVDFIKREISIDKSRAFDARDISAKYTCDTICSCTFGTDAQSFTAENPFFFQNGQEMLRSVSNASTGFFPKKLIPVEVEEFFVDMAVKAIKYRFESGIKQDDFLAHIISIKDRKGLSDVDAASFCVTLFLDGFETTSLTLHQTLYELGRHKQVQDKLRSEIMENLSDDGVVSYEKLLELPYLDQVFHETLRLHPPLPILSRECSEDCEFNDREIVIKKGSTVWIPIYSIHRDPGT